MTVADRVSAESYGTMKQESLQPPGSNVLVLEDDQSISELLVWVLSEAGYRVTSASTVGEAIRICRERVPDVIVADLLLPDGMSSELLDDLRARGKNDSPPSIVMSALPHARRRAEEAGARHCLPKPFDLTELLDTVSHLAPRAPGSIRIDRR